MTVDLLNQAFREVFDDDSIAAGAAMPAHDLGGWDPPLHVNRVRFTQKELLTRENVGDLLAGFPKKES